MKILKPAPSESECLSSNNTSINDNSTGCICYLLLHTHVCVGTCLCAALAAIASTDSNILPPVMRLANAPEIGEAIQILTTDVLGNLTVGKSLLAFA